MLADEIYDICCFRALESVLTSSDYMRFPGVSTKVEACVYPVINLIGDALRTVVGELCEQEIL